MTWWSTIRDGLTASGDCGKDYCEGVLNIPPVLFALVGAVGLIFLVKWFISRGPGAP